MRSSLREDESCSVKARVVTRLSNQEMIGSKPEALLEA